ncbi:hypothetical protein D9M70_634440 [compost metagenome]
MPPGCATDGLIDTAQAACRCTAQFFHRYIGGGQRSEGWHVVQQHHHGLAGLVFGDRDSFFNSDSWGDGGDGDGRWLTTEYQSPVTDKNGSQ